MPLEKIFGKDALVIDPLKRLHPLEAAEGVEAGEIPGEMLYRFNRFFTTGGESNARSLNTQICLTNKKTPLNKLINQIAF